MVTQRATLSFLGGVFRPECPKAKPATGLVDYIFTSETERERELNVLRSETKLLDVATFALHFFKTAANMPRNIFSLQVRSTLVRSH